MDAQAQRKGWPFDSHGAGDAAWRLLGALAAEFRCRLCWRITLVVFAAIYVIESVILIPSCINFERDLLTRLAATGREMAAASIRLDPAAAPGPILATAARLTGSRSIVTGGALFAADGTALGSFGEAPRTGPATAPWRSEDGRRYEIAWDGRAEDSPYRMVVRLDSSGVRAELIAFVWRIFGLSSLIAAFVTVVTMFVLGRTVLTPMLTLRRHLLAAGESPDAPGRIAPNPARTDEWSDVVDAFNQMIGANAANLERIRRTQRDLAEAKAAAERATEAKSAFLSQISHELRTPLTSILGYAELLEREPSEAKQRRYLASITRAGWQILDHINELLDLARIEAGKADLRIGAVDPGAVVDEALSLVAPIAEKHGASLVEAAVERATGPVRADPRRLRQVLLNLLSNAIKYGGRDGTVTLDRRVTPAGFVRFSVSDRGPGIPPERRGQVFTLFSRLGADATPVPGSGIGLAIAKQLVELMGGAIGFDSVVGQGTTFWFDLPPAPSP